MKAVVEKRNVEVAQVSDEILQDYLKSLGNNLPERHIKKFIHIAKAFNLNPFIREIHGIPYGDNFNIIVGYEVYIKRAERSRKLAGWRAWTEGSLQNGDLKGCIEIERKDWSKPFYHEVYYDEYNQNNSIWRTKPRTMIKKVVIAQGFRLAFPDELAGMPYTADELPDAQSAEVIEAQQVKKDITKEFAIKALEFIPKQALKQFSEYAKEAGYDLTNDNVKEMLLKNEEEFKKLIESFKTSMEAEEAL